METNNISFDEDNSSLPDLPNLSQGSSVSSTMEVMIFKLTNIKKIIN